MIDDKALQERYAAWLQYWCSVIVQQHNEDQDADTTDGPLYVDDADKAINGIIVAALLDRIDGLERQIRRTG